jgi:hypothetical protein
MAQRSPKGPNQREHGGKSGDGTPLKPARSAHADQLTHEEPEIEAARMNQQPLADIPVTAEVYATHPTGLKEMGKG